MTAHSISSIVQQKRSDCHPTPSKIVLENEALFKVGVDRAEEHVKITLQTTVILIEPHTNHVYELVVKWMKAPATRRLGL